MNRKQLKKLGVLEEWVDEALAGIQSAVTSGMRGKDARAYLTGVLANPEAYQEDSHFARLAKKMVEEPVLEKKTQVAYRTWGSEYIDAQSRKSHRSWLHSRLVTMILPGKRFVRPVYASSESAAK